MRVDLTRSEIRNTIEALRDRAYQHHDDDNEEAEKRLDDIADKLEEALGD